MSVWCCNMRKNFRVRWASSGEEGGGGGDCEQQFFCLLLCGSEQKGMFFFKALIHFVKTQLAFHHCTRKPSVNFPTTLWYGMVESRGKYHEGPRGFT